MAVDRDLLALIRRAAPTPVDAAELIASLLQGMNRGDRRRVVDELFLSGVFDDERVESIVELSLGSAPLPDLDEWTSAREVASETRELLAQRLFSDESAGWTDITEEAANLGRRLLVVMQRAGRIVVLPVEGRQLVPSFQFEMGVPELVPRFIVQRANLAIDAGRDPWGAYSWWTSPNGWLGGDSPADVVGTPGENDLALLAESLSVIEG